MPNYTLTADQDLARYEALLAKKEALEDQIRYLQRELDVVCIDYFSLITS